jgi:hypothetical protein
MKASTFLFATGFMLTLGAVGGIENDGPLFDCLLVAVLGLATMGCGALMIRQQEASRPKHNPTLW